MTTGRALPRLVGPPGTGKTLLAKAVAGEAGPPHVPSSSQQRFRETQPAGAAFHDALVPRRASIFAAGIVGVNIGLPQLYPSKSQVATDGSTYSRQASLSSASRRLSSWRSSRASVPRACETSSNKRRRHTADGDGGVRGGGNGGDRDDGCGLLQFILLQPRWGGDTNIHTEFDMVTSCCLVCCHLYQHLSTSNPRQVHYCWYTY